MWRSFSSRGWISLQGCLSKGTASPLTLCFPWLFTLPCFRQRCCPHKVICSIICIFRVKQLCFCEQIFVAFYSFLFSVKNWSGFSDVNKFTEFLLSSSWPDLFLFTFLFSSVFLTALMLVPLKGGCTYGVTVPGLRTDTTHTTPCMCIGFLMSVQLV